MADLYAAVTDDAVNRIIGFAHARAPFLFNYVAPSMAFVTDEHGQITGVQDLWTTCSPVPDPPPNVPRYRRMQPFELPGIPIKLPYSIQIVEAKLDFHPSDALTLPEELLPPLAPQRFGLKVLLDFGFACLPPNLIEMLTRRHFGVLFERQLDVLPVTELNCFVLTVYATGHLTVQSTPQAGQPHPLEEIRLEVDGMEIVDIRPPGLESVVECYLVALLKGYVLPELVLGLQRLATNTLGLTGVTPFLTPGQAHDPAIENNELRVWLDLDFK